MAESWIEFVAARAPELWQRIGEHLMPTAVSTSLAILIGIPLGVVTHRPPGLRGPLLGAIGMLQTIPSLAMLARLAGLLDDETMQSLNDQVDHGQRRPVEVARDFLREQDLI